MKAIITTKSDNYELTVTGPDIAVQGGMFGIEHIVDGKKVWLYLPIKSLIKIEIHE